MIVRSQLSGLYAITPNLTDTTLLVELVAAAIEGGARVIQYRNKDAVRDLMMHQASELASLCRRLGVKLIINDDVELAGALEADGVHLGRDDADLAQTRTRLGPNAIIGMSCYASAERALDAQRRGADYVAFGSMFASTTKPGAPPAPLSIFQQTRALGVTLPLAAIGGINLDNVERLKIEGAQLFAIIGALFGAAANPEVVRERACQFCQRLSTER